MEDDEEKAEKILNIVGIYYSNCLVDGVEIKRARFNHSCRPNTFQQLGPNGVSKEIRAVSNIEPGQEITINYAVEKLLFNMRSKETRQEILWINCNVTNCFCDFCKEDTNDKTVIGSKMDELIAELELLASNCTAAMPALQFSILMSADIDYEKSAAGLFTPEKCRRHVDLCKEIYKFGKERKDPTISLFTILNNGYIAAHLGILMVWKGPKKEMAEGFKKDCISFCKANESFSKWYKLFTPIGKHLVTAEEWRERRQDYDKYLEDFVVKLA